MNRSGYEDDLDHWPSIRWRGAVASAIRGKRGQAFLRELAAALDALPEPRLVAQSFSRDGGVCALGAVCQARGIDLDRHWDEDDIPRDIAPLLGIAPAMAAEIMYINDDDPDGVPAERWRRVRTWVQTRIT